MNINRETIWRGHQEDYR